MLSFLNKIKNSILDILFPPICLHCRKALITDEYLCETCFNSIQLNTSLFCPVCRLRLAENKKICGHANYLLGAAVNYDNPVFRDLIHYFKYESFENLAPLLGETLLKYIENCKLKIDNFIIVPIPLHRVKEKYRGFNQSKLLAKNIGAYFNLEIIDALKRVKNTKPQAQFKNSEQRIKNVKDCFVMNEFAINAVKNKNILLIDDVFTTGTTINEAIRILKQKRARKIIALVLAKA